MELPDGTTLMHGKFAYDPVKAHAYYIRTRQLKGRKGGQGTPPMRKSPLIGDTGSPTYTITLPSGETAILTRQQLIEQKAFAAKRVTEIKAKLSELGSVLRKAMSEAKKKKAAAELKASKPQTAAEQSKAARESKQYRDKHKTSIATKTKVASTKTANKTDSASTDPVAELETKVTQIKDTLRAAVASQRALITATQNR